MDDKTKEQVTQWVDPETGLALPAGSTVTPLTEQIGMTGHPFRTLVERRPVGGQQDTAALLSKT